MSAPLVRAFEIPKGLTSADRSEVIRTIGLNSAPKALSNPYPLGGYSGFELGYSVEFINVRDIRRIGCTPGSTGCANTTLTDTTEWRYSRFTIGKGLYHDLDIFFSFIPPMGNVRTSDYGGQVRWSFFQAEFLPVNLSVSGYFNQLNFNDTFMNRNIGGDLLVGVNVNNFALYFGGGWMSARGTFIGKDVNNSCAEDCTVDTSDDALNTNSRTVSQEISNSHTVVGFSLHYQNLFAAAQVDRYTDAVYSLKVGLRY
ncbi:MAG: hypothetical protein AB7F86_17415 [Bdellovibrionales bacterium]